jgi:hypothetical protein
MVTQYKPYPIPMSLGTGFGDVFDSVHVSVFYSVRVCAQVRARVHVCVRMRVCACVFMVGGSLDETLRGRKEQTLCEKQWYYYSVHDHHFGRLNHHGNRESLSTVNVNLQFKQGVSGK